MHFSPNPKLTEFWKYEYNLLFIWKLQLELILFVIYFNYTVLLSCFIDYFQKYVIFHKKVHFYPKNCSNVNIWWKSVIHMKTLIDINVTGNSFELHSVFLYFYRVFPEICDFSSFFTFLPPKKVKILKKVNTNGILYQNRA